jgi:predicted aconitase with swiveling domain
MQGLVLVAGEAGGVALVSSEPLSFWGGYDQNTGEIIDRRHPLAGQIAAGRVLAIPMTRGSSTTAAVFLEAARAGAAPAGVLTSSVDHFLVLAAVVADEMYGIHIPIFALSAADFATLQTGQHIRMASDGRVTAVSS